MNIKLTIRILTLVIAVSAALPGLAFNSDKPKAQQFRPEQSQDQLASQQALQGKFNEVGVVDDHVGDDSVNGTVKGNSQSGSFANADSATAIASLNQATQKRAQKGNSFPWLTLCLVCGFGILGAIAFKSYTDKIPLPDSLKPKG